MSGDGGINGAVPVWLRFWFKTDPCTYIDGWVPLYHPLCQNADKN